MKIEAYDHGDDRSAEHWRLLILVARVASATQHTGIGLRPHWYRGRHLGLTSNRSAHLSQVDLEDVARGGAAALLMLAALRSVGAEVATDYEGDRHVMRWRVAGRTGLVHGDTFTEAMAKAFVAGMIRALEASG